MCGYTNAQRGNDILGPDGFSDLIMAGGRLEIDCLRLPVKRDEGHVLVYCVDGFKLNLSRRKTEKKQTSVFWAGVEEELSSRYK